MVSCGGNGKKQNAEITQQTTSAKSSSTAIKDVDNSNWQAVIKANFGVDIVLPAGWSLKEVKSLNDVTNIKLYLNIGAGATGIEVGKSLFEATKALSPHGNYKGKPDWDNNTVAAGDVIDDFSKANAGSETDIIASWNFTFNSRMVQLNYYTSGNEAEYTFNS
jgi:hypothetical protein